jgi:formylglycine-generating enzyme required for sulfatase activity
MVGKLSRIFCVVLLLGSAVADSSEKCEVTGQVFVVTKGGESVKLGLVGIHVVDERRLTEIAARLLGVKAQEALLLKFESEVKEMLATVPEAFAAQLRRIGEDAVRRRQGITGFSGHTLSSLFLAELPAAAAQTDADGLFTVEASVSSWMAARGQRRVGSTTETYLWLMPLKTKSRKLLVSNDRLIEDDAALARILDGVGRVSQTEKDQEAVNWVNGQRKAAKQAMVDAKAAEEQALVAAKEKAEAVETALAMKLGLRRPFAPGLRGEVGRIAVRWIPAGRFTMGSPSSEEGRYSDEVEHEVVLSRGFFLAETECTQEQWEAVMGRNPSRFKGTDRPVEQVSWEEVVEFCRRLTLNQRQEGILPEGGEWRLPTEAEWEYAARAGTTGAWHGELDAIAWYDDNSCCETHAVKGKQPNAWGLFDMIGNVWEWCADWYGEYPTGSVTDPTGPSSRHFRVLRGGSWLDVAKESRPARRDEGDPGRGQRRRPLTLKQAGMGVPGHRFHYLGFRPALSPVR